jgi:hypothetical protein
MLLAKDEYSSAHVETYMLEKLTGNILSSNLNRRKNAR